MTTSGAEQLTLAGLAPRKRRKRAPAEHTPAEQHPIAQVVLDVQALHLGQTFDYFIDEKDSEATTGCAGARAVWQSEGQRCDLGTHRYQ